MIQYLMCVIIICTNKLYTIGNNEIDILDGLERGARGSFGRDDASRSTASARPLALLFHLSAYSRCTACSVSETSGLIGLRTCSNVRVLSPRD